MFKNVRLVCRRRSCSTKQRVTPEVVDISHDVPVPLLPIQEPVAKGPEKLAELTSVDVVGTSDAGIMRTKDNENRGEKTQ